MRPSAIFLLGWGLVRATARRVVRPRGGDERALRGYAADRIRGISEAERAARAGTGRCIACGFCDESPDLSSPSDWILARLRDPTDRDVSDAPTASEDAWRALEARCPVSVPFRDLSRP